MYRFIKTNMFHHLITIRLTKLFTFFVLSTISLGLLPAPAQSSDNEVLKSNVLNKIMSTKTLVLAATKGNSTFFAADGFEHGFGYDVVRKFARDLDVNISLKVYQDNKSALHAVKFNEADIALTTSSNRERSNLSLASINLSCGRDAKLTNNGLHPNVNWAFSDPNISFSRVASNYICDNKNQQYISKLASFYSQTAVKDEVGNAHIKEALSGRLPKYKPSFKKYATNYNHDWELLVAIGYQESHLDAKATSPTGVRGIMMLTKDTAKEVGVNDRLNPHQSIRGGAEYLYKMKKKFADVPTIDRTWFALAAYNMGPYAVKDIQQSLKRRGLDENNWMNVYVYMSENQDSNSRYVQCMKYVSNIKSYLEAIKTYTAP